MAPREPENLDAIIEAPPTWEEVMHGKETSIELHNISQEQGEGSSWNTKKGGRDETGVFIKKEKENEIIPELEARIEEGPRISCCGKIWKHFKVSLLVSFIIMDLTLWGASVKLITWGSYILKQEEWFMEMIAHVYEKETRALGQVFVIFGSIYIGLMVPFGIFGVWRSRKGLVKWHNIWLLLNLVAEAILSYRTFKYLESTSEEKKKSSFQANFIKVYGCSYQKATRSCDCDYKIDPRPMEYPYKQGNIPLADYKEDCVNGYYGFLKLQEVMREGLNFFTIFMIIQATTLIFGLFAKECIPEIEDVTDCAEPLVEEKPKKKKKGIKIGLFYRVLLYFFVKRLFIIVFAVVLSMAYWIIQKYTQEIEIPLESSLSGKPLTVNAWDLIQSVFFFKTKT